MKILIISGTHPATPHISGVRAWRFAEGLARRGHQCVVICPAMAGDEDGAGLTFEGHGWSAPMLSPVEDGGDLATSPMGTLYHLLRHGGRRMRFYRAAKSRALAIVQAFEPDIGWATFGSLEAVVAMRDAAAKSHLPWVLDIKDNPDIYIPGRARRALAWRLRGFRQVLANAGLHAAAGTAWLGTPVSTIYSGVASEFFAAPGTAMPITRHVTLVGSLYRADQVDAFVAGVAAFNSGVDPDAALSIMHLGTQGDLVRQAAERHGGVEWSAPGYISTDAMAAICKSAFANAYIFLGMTFHHKLLELLACRRPVIAFGGELPESIALAAELRAPLAAPQTADALMATLQQIDHGALLATEQMPARFFAWDDQVAKLDDALQGILRR